MEFEPVINIEQSKDTLKEFIAFSNPDTCWISSKKDIAYFSPCALLHMYLVSYNQLFLQNPDFQSLCRVYLVRRLLFLKFDSSSFDLAVLLEPTNTLIISKS